jgi:hypothetical protein
MSAMKVAQFDRLSERRLMLWSKPEILESLKQLVRDQIAHHYEEATILQHRIVAWEDNGKLGGDEGWQALSALRRLKMAMAVEELPDKVDTYLLQAVSF